MSRTDAQQMLHSASNNHVYKPHILSSDVFFIGIGYIVLGDSFEHFDCCSPEKGWRPQRSNSLEEGFDYILIWNVYSPSQAQSYFSLLGLSSTSSVQVNHLWFLREANGSDQPNMGTFNSHTQKCPTCLLFVIVRQYLKACARQHDTPRIIKLFCISFQHKTKLHSKLLLVKLAGVFYLLSDCKKDKTSFVKKK